jgi:hypothetical protein
VFKVLNEFQEAVFLRVAMESLLIDEEVSHGSNGHYFDPTVGSRSNFATRSQRLFSLGLIWNPNSMTRRSRRPDLSDG